MEFKAVYKEDKELVIKAVVEKKLNKAGGTDVTIHLPGPLMVNAKIEELKKTKNIK